MEPFTLFDAPYSPDLLLGREEQPSPAYLTKDGVTFLGRFEGQSFVIERLLSTNPYDYLHYEPGMRC